MIGKAGGNGLVGGGAGATASACGLLGRRRVASAFVLPFVIAMVLLAAYSFAWGRPLAANAVVNAQATAAAEIADLQEGSADETAQGKAVAVADAQDEPLASSRLLDVPAVFQYPELPTGCESVALTSLLSYYGFDLEKTEIAASWLPTSDIDFVHAFLGNPFDAWGHSCMAPALVSAADAYLAAHGSPLRASDLTGSSFSDLLDLVADGAPVVAWCTIDLAEPDDPYQVAYEDGFEYDLRANSHCVTLSGYDLDAGLVYVSDPLVGQVSYPIDVFATRYYELGAQAVCLS